MNWKFDKCRKSLLIEGEIDRFLDQMNDRNDKTGDWGKEDLKSVLPWREYMDEILLIEAPEATVIPPITFSWMPNLVAVDISSAVAIGNGAFFDCPSLDRVIMPSAQIIGNGAFSGCTSLKGSNGTEKLELREMRHISRFAFFNCQSLKNVTFTREAKRTNEKGESISEGAPFLEFVGDYAFAGCTSLEKFSCGGKASRAVFGKDSFRGCPINQAMSDYETEKGEIDE